MGSFFTNIQLKHNTSNQKQFINNVKKSIITLFRKQNLELTDNEQKSERCILIKYSPDNNWISIYDELSEKQESELSELAKVLSKKCKTDAVTITVNDSDILLTELFNNGEHIDLHNTYPEYFKDAPGSKGQTSKWAHLLNNSSDKDKLEELFKKKNEIFPEDWFIRDFAALLGLKLENISTGYNYLLEDQINPEIKLYFYNNTSEHPQILTNPPKLVSGYSIKKANYSVQQCIAGEQLRLGIHNITNKGIKSRGIKVKIPVKNNGIFIPLSCELYETKYPKSGGMTSDRILSDKFIRNNDHYEVVFPDYILSQGYEIHETWKKDFFKIIRARSKGYEDIFSIIVEGKCNNPDQDEIIIEVLPLENEETGKLSSREEININPSTKEPVFINFENKDTIPGFVKNMIDGKELFIFITFHELSEDTKKQINNDINDFLGLSKEYANKNLMMFVYDYAQFGEQKIKVNFVFDKKDTVDSNYKGGYFFCDNSTIASYQGKDVTVLLFWINKTFFSKQGIKIIESFFQQVDMWYAENSKIVQSYIGHWNEAPVYKEIGMSTLYEQLYGQNQHNLFSLKWTTKKIRCLTNWIRLGEPFINELSKELVSSNNISVFYEFDTIRFIIKNNKGYTDIQRILNKYIPFHE